MPRRPHHDRRAPRIPRIGTPAPPVGLDVRVELAGHIVRLEDLRARPDLYARWFAWARRTPGHAICLCRPGGTHLVIRERAGRDHLARWPTPGRVEHDLRCPFSAEPRRSGAFTTTSRGTRITITASRSPGAPDPPADRPSPDGRCDTVNLTDLLDRLWTDSGLATAPPRTRRRWADVYAALAPAIAALRLGGQPAPRLCHVVAPFRPGSPDPARDARLAEFLAALEHPRPTVIRGGPRRGDIRRTRPRRLLLGELKGITHGPDGQQLTLGHFPRRISLPDPRRDRTPTPPVALRATDRPGARRVVLAVVDPAPAGGLRLVDAAVMRVTPDFRPADDDADLRRH